MNIVYKSKTLCWSYCKISQLRFNGFKKEVERRSKLDLLDYKNIAQPLPKCYYELCTDNNCFGIGYCLRQYIGSSKSYINAMAEHGYFFGSYVQELAKDIYAKKILTFSDLRKNHIESVIDNKEVIPIGPYIHYAPDYYNELRLKQEKAKFGRLLLVFFSHSATGKSVSFDLDELINKINSVRNDFDTIVVSLFWSDINPLIEKRLKDEGYLIFSSGHRYDYYFLSRQKTMIKLADVTMSNFTGTHLAYCSYLNKPHWIIRQIITSKALNSKGRANMVVSEKMMKDAINRQEQEELYQAFSSYSTCLNESQKEICDKYFGLSCVRSVDEMREILK